MKLHALTWNDEYGTYTEWYSSKVKIAKARAVLKKEAKENPEHHIVIVCSLSHDINTSVEGLIRFLNIHANN